MNNAQVADVLRTLGSILEIKGENTFKVRAYVNASRTIEGLGTDLRKIIEEGKLREIPGIGEGLAQKITELVTTGRLAYYEELRREVPAGVLDMLRIPSLGPKKAKILWEELGLTSIDALREACAANKLLELKGFGPKAQQKILEGIEFHGSHQGEFLLIAALPLARQVVEHLKGSKHVGEISVAGSLRRWKEVIRDIDILVGSKTPEKVMEYFAKAPYVTEILVNGETKTSIRMASGIQVDLRVVAPDQFPAALVYFTGSKEHNVSLRSLAIKKGLKVSEYGIFKGTKALSCKDETEFYKRLGLPYVPPELRENAGEFDGPLPDLIELSDLKGVFHTHSTWSDGTAEIEAMAEKARSMGLQYMGLSDHSKAAAYANGMDEVRLRKQMKEIDRLNKKWKNFVILKGLECDILPTGELDLNPKILGDLDFVIGSIHSRFDMTEDEMTGRVCKALGNKHMDIFGHATGRLLLDRKGYKIDLERVIEAARKQNKVIELNANPHRLDLDWVHCRMAKKAGVLISINPDAHSTSGLEDIQYGVATARRGWLEAKDVLNTRDLDDVRKIIDS